MAEGDGADLIDQLLEGRVKAALFGADRAPRLGRLVVLEPIGSGAMGTVFAAYDPTLDRKVAVKILASSGEVANRRLLREARALGKLAHPNVVAIHDAGEVGGAVYVVMELVSGTNLREWAETNPGWREIASVMADVAAGLHAAHTAGLVHADVKPENILVGDDRVRVVDFGLARVAREQASGNADGLPAALAATAPDASGSIGGTPSYMAPEVLNGEPPAAAADQFAFAVTLFECLYGERPYQVKKVTELAAAAKTAADAKRPDSRAPRRLHSAVLRGLAATPSDRYESMESFAAALRDARRRRRRLFAVAGLAAAALVLAGFLGVRAGAGESDPCSGGPEQLARSWDGSRRAVIADRLGPDRWAENTLNEIDKVGEVWRASYRRVCEATRVRGSQSDTLLDLRMRCLERQRERLTALIEAIEQEGGARSRFAAASAVEQLPSASRCETMREARELALPADAADRALVASASVSLDRGWAQFALGRYREALVIARAVSADVGKLTFPPLRAQLLLLSGAVEGRIGNGDAARDRLQTALHAAAAAGAVEVELDAWLRLLRGELFGGSRQRVTEWAPFARAAATRAGVAPAEINGIVGEALRGLGRLADARRLLVEALNEPSLIGQRRAIVEMNLGTVELLAGSPRAGEAAFSRARRLATDALGSDHPSVALYIDKLAISLREQGQIKAALLHHATALNLRERAYGPDDRAVATSLVRRAATSLEAGQLEAARGDLDRAETIRTAIYGPRHRRLADIATARGDLAAAVGLNDVASGHYREASELDGTLPLAGKRVAVNERVALEELRPVSEDGASSLQRFAEARARVIRLVETKQTTKARGDVDRMVTKWQRLADPGAALSSQVGVALLTQGDRERAIDVFTKALKSLGSEPSLARLRALRGRLRAGVASDASEIRDISDALPELD